MAGNLRGGAANGGVIRLQTFEGLPLQRTGEKRTFKRIQLSGDVVVLVKVRIIKHLGENLFGQDVLNQHFPHIRIGQRRVDGLLRMHQKLFFSLPKRGISHVSAFNHVAQRIEHGGQVSLELLDCGAKAGNLGALEAEEKFE